MTQVESERIAVLETKVDGINERLDKIIADHESRIRCLESKPGKMWNVLTAAIVTGVIGALVGAVFAIFVK